MSISDGFIFTQINFQKNDASLQTIFVGATLAVARSDVKIHLRAAARAAPTVGQCNA